MGRFNIDDILRGLGEPSPTAPAEPSPGPAQQDVTPQDAGSGEATAEGAPGAESTAAPARVARAVNSGPRVTGVVRRAAEEIPRPPDASGTGLGEALDPGLPARGASPTRTRPDDALSDLYTPEATVGGAAPDLLALLQQRNAITGEQLATVERLHRQTPGRPLAQVLVDAGIDETIVQSAVATVHGLPFERIRLDDPDASYDHKAFHRLGADYCLTNLVLPLRHEGGRLLLGTVRPDDVFLLDDVKRRLGISMIKPVLVTAFDLRGLVETVVAAGQEEEIDLNQIVSDLDEEDVEVVKEDKVDDGIEGEAESSPVVKYVNHIISSALKEKASDIHIEPEEKNVKVRFRIDGVLFEMMHPPKRMHAALTSRIKIMAGLDIAERRMPQDGRIRMTINGKKIDLRVSTVPTPKGEKTVMRILDTKNINVTLDDLGFADETLSIWKKQIEQPHGIILVTGPTGSGKTTTLYASIRQMDLQRLNVSTVEDPVEYNLANITQIQTHDKIGMTFARALKALLRQDPDVILLGEIRDMETATTAIQAALTGHLVLSTLHTNDAPSSVTRLVNIGIEPFLVGAALSSVLAQRLVRRICPGCAVEEPISPELVDFVAMHGVVRDKLPIGKGCGSCRQTGYSGRLGLYELLVLDDHLRDLVAGNPNVTEFRRICCERGMVTLRQDGFEKVNRGVTTVEEILRVTEATI